MKNLLFFLCATVVLSCGSSHPATSQEISQGSYMAPGYKKKKYKKIMVMALIKQTIYRKRIENSLVEQLKDRGYKAFSSTEVFTDEMLLDTARMRKTAEENGVDAAIIIRYLGTTTTIVDQANYNGNIYSFFGVPFSTIDLDTRDVNVGLVQIDFVIQGVIGTQYRTGVPLKLSNGSDLALEEFSLTTRKKLINDKVL